MVKSQTYGADKNILIAPELAFTIGCIIGNTGISAGSDGKKIIKAGTPVGGTTSVLTNRQTVLTVTADVGSETKTNAAQGVVLHDVDVTDGNQNATLVIAGFVDLLKIDETVTITDAAKAAMPKITFLNGRDE